MQLVQAVGRGTRQVCPDPELILCALICFCWWVIIPSLCAKPEFQRKTSLCFAPAMTVPISRHPTAQSRAVLGGKEESQRGGAAKPKDRGETLVQPSLPGARGWLGLRGMKTSCWGRTRAALGEK